MDFEDLRGSPDGLASGAMPPNNSPASAGDDSPASSGEDSPAPAEDDGK